MKGILTGALLGLLAAGCDDTITVRVAPDGAIASPAAAREAVRRIRARQAKDGRVAPVEVVFADGVYRLGEPLRLTAEDSHATWRAEHRGKAVFTAGTALDWRPLADAAVRDLLPAAARDRVLVADVPGAGPLPSFLNGSHCNTPTNDIQMELFQGGERLVCARGPNADFHRTGDTDVKPPLTGRRTLKPGSFAFDRGKIAAWSREPFPWVFGLWGVYWSDLKCPLSHLDAEKGRIWMDNPLYIQFGLNADMPFYVFNAFCELDTPGEWVVDRARRRLYAWPKAGLPPPEAALGTNILALAGVTNLTVDGIVFEKSRLDAISIRDCERVTVRACAVRHTCSWGVWVEGGRNCRIAGCDMTDLGQGGIRLEGGDRKTLARADHIAENNHISHFGKVFYNYRPGIWLGGVGNSAVHNLVHHSPHTGIYARGNDLCIGWNVIHDTCSFNDDAGAIYVWNMSFVLRRVVIEHNVIHFTGKPQYPSNTEAIYLDDCSPENVVRHNFINRANIGVMLGGGQCNETYGNVFLNCEKSVALSTRQTWPLGQAGRKSSLFAELDADYATHSSPKWRAHYPGLAKLLDATCDPVTAHHAFWNVVSNNVSYHTGAATRSCWEAISNTTVWADNVACGATEPPLADYWNFDWRAKPGAPHADVIAACRFGEAGLYASPERLTPPVKFGPGVTRPEPWGEPRAMPAARISCVLNGKLPEGVPAFADDTRGCIVPRWSRGLRTDWNTRLDTRAGADYQNVTFSFVPAFDCSFSLEVMGGMRNAAPTEYADIAVSGATLPKEGLFSGKMPFRANDAKHIRSRPLAARKGERVTVTYRCRIAPETPARP